MMSTTIASTSWQLTINEISRLLRAEFKRQHPFTDDGDVSPNTVALRDAIFAFPFATDVLLIDVGSVASPGHYSLIFSRTDAPPSSRWTMIAHDVASKDRGIRFHGCRRLADFDGYKALLLEQFGFEESQLEEVRTLRSNGYWYSDARKFVDFVAYDISEQSAMYAQYLVHTISVDHAVAFIDRYKKQLNFNEVYSLPDDPVLTFEELTKIDELTACFGRGLDGGPPSIEDRQRDVASIQLIPKVPEDVRQTFSRAKDAYIFGYFRYGLFTISVHYASLALEAAIKARWSVSLPQKINVLCGRDKVEMHYPSHTRIDRLRRERKWRRCDVLVEGERFPATMHDLLDWLENKKIATKWERRQLTDGLKLRNILSHLEHAQTDMPNAGTLVFVAECINKLFHRLP